jgi:hypothetical protein
LQCCWFCITFWHRNLVYQSKGNRTSINFIYYINKFLLY